MTRLLHRAQDGAGGACDTGGRFVLGMPADACGEPSFYAVGAPLSVAYARAADGTCSPTTASLTHHALGAPALAHTFVRAVRGLRASGVLRVQTLNVEGVPVADVGFADATGQRCYPRAFVADGRTRCLPRSVPGRPGGIFEDAACTVVILQLPPFPSCVALPALSLQTTYAPDLPGHEGVTEVRSVEIAPPGPRFVLSPDGTCVESTTPPAPDLVELRVLSRVPPDTFPVLTTHVE